MAQQAQHIMYLVPYIRYLCYILSYLCYHYYHVKTRTNHRIKVVNPSPHSDMRLCMLLQ